MNNENKTIDQANESASSLHTQSIHEYEFKLICDFFSNTERQGPGSPEATLRALSFVDNLTDKSRIADLGCGTGGQTMVLAQHAPGQITGLDLFPDFINIFNRNVEQNGLQDRVKGIVGSMDNLPFQYEEFDLIWSEGAIDNIGFERGLHEWRKFLKTGGYIAVSDLTWFTEERPAEIHDYYMAHSPHMDTIPNKVAQIQQAGYIPVATFILPETCWTEHYYTPLIRAQELFLDKYAGDKMAEEFVTFQRYDAELYRKYKAFYGYAFYIAKKTGQ